MIRRPPRATRTDTLVPYTTLFRSVAIPHDLAAFVAEQLGLHVTELANYAARDQTMTDHVRELAARLGLRGPTRADIPFMVEAAARTAWATDKGMTIAIGVEIGRASCRERGCQYV